MSLTEEINARILSLNDLRVMVDKLDALALDRLMMMGDGFVLYSRKSLAEAREDARRIGDVLGTHEWKMTTPFNCFNMMYVDLEFTTVPMTIRCEFKADEFPIDEVSPGCRMERREHVEVSYAIACDAVPDPVQQH
jgi:hypothetical protein